MNHSLYKLVPPRPSFPAGMTQVQGAIMEAHFGYWAGLIAERRDVAYGPVADPNGTHGVAVVEVADEAIARSIATNDPGDPVECRLRLRAALDDRRDGAVVTAAG